MNPIVITSDLLAYLPGKLKFSDFNSQQAKPDGIFSAEGARLVSGGGCVWCVCVCVCVRACACACVRVRVRVCVRVRGGGPVADE
jgi:hypothetical protein